MTDLPTQQPHRRRRAGRTRRAQLAALAAGAALGLPAPFALVALAESGELADPPAETDPADPAADLDAGAAEPESAPPLAEPEPAPEPPPPPDAPTRDNLAAVQRAELELRRNARGWINRCEALAEWCAYGRTGLWRSAWAAALAPDTKRSHWSLAPLGAIVFFGPNRGNGGNGHAGIVTGPNEMISATYAGVRRDFISRWHQAVAPYVGWRA